MPAGVSWSTYLKFMGCALLSMVAGSQVVHSYYKPLDDLEAYVVKELENNPSIDPAKILNNIKK